MSGGGSFRSLTQLTCLELPRQPALLLVATTLILFMGSLPFLITHDLGEAGKLVRDSSLALIFLGSLLLAVPASCNAISTEIQRGTAGAILTKPVSRVQFLASKFIGVSMVTLSFCGMALLTLIMTDRAASLPNTVGWRHLAPVFLAVGGAYLVAGLLNYSRKQPFTSTAFWLMGLFLVVGFGLDCMDSSTPGTRWAILPAGILLVLAALMIQALAFLCALRWAIVPSLSICLGLFLTGLISDYLFLTQAENALWARVLYTLIPNWQHFWMADALTAGGAISWDYVAGAAGYAAVWTLGVLAVAMGCFEQMEVRS